MTSDEDPNTELTWLKWSPDRDRLLLELVAAGRTDADIADALGVTRSAVKMRKCRVQTREWRARR